jgi:hypothetical protein
MSVFWAFLKLCSWYYSSFFTRNRSWQDASSDTKLCGLNHSGTELVGTTLWSTPHSEHRSCPLKSDKSHSFIRNHENWLQIRVQHTKLSGFSCFGVIFCCSFGNRDYRGSSYELLHISHETDLADIFTVGRLNICRKSPGISAQTYGPFSRYRYYKSRKFGHILNTMHKSPSQ